MVKGVGKSRILVERDSWAPTERLLTIKLVYASTTSTWDPVNKKWKHTRPVKVDTGANWKTQVDECKAKPKPTSPTTNCRTDVETTAKPIWP